MSTMLPKNKHVPPDSRSSAAAATAEESFEGTITVYLRSSTPDVARDRQQATVARLSELVSAGVIDGFETVHWQNKIRDPAGGPTPEPIERYDEFAERVGPEALQPFFEERPGIGRIDRVVVLPVICLVARLDGELIGLYPHWNGGTHESIEDGLGALESGSIQNV
ncbi:MAG: hypothetical protein PPP58_11330 [Natronomonas sp.]